MKKVRHNRGFKRTVPFGPLLARYPVACYGVFYYSKEGKKMSVDMIREAMNGAFGAILAGVALLALFFVLWRLHGRRRSLGGDIWEEIDGMEGHEFERWCAELLRENGFQNVEVTKGSYDQGVDILAKKDDIRYGVQCKCYDSNLGNTPVQEVFTGKTIYHCHVGVVMTNSYFTEGARKAAEATGVILWDRDRLEQMMEAADRDL